MGYEFDVRRFGKSSGRFTKSPYYDFDLLILTNMMIKMPVRNLIIQITLFLLVVAVLIGGCKKKIGYDEMINARDSLRVGMTRQEADLYLSTATSHLICNNDGETSVELYLFGSDDLSTAHILYTLYEMKGGEEILVSVTNIEREFLQRIPSSPCTETKG